ncbi:hypothetical protein A8924_4703 [Saccharopolyspora erythraea NRRL 2338]|uniref:Uncharacterized protein n=2 Tax=Saccharopolyspora erythraea TaxID=1836 RepID=A4FHR0_SACEN|nr:hypothetical protein [Saccharopolyspora erythraea]EQD83113.1 hypothetical protein N599_27050 [Saccharopolyspora erythraea D]PFG97272.1 hypothetical protein A8924_4703 [Saccharopolyspora erythraea NRRL 2338]QRK87467.1 hypothetical protein JQX30_21985 [Saccharopolyspora erythraea]CAM03585.1 hypothetical protein SACE_4316 [Saccharopolyspora erythraea NRRL 2338]
MTRRFLHGLAAGAAGTTALNAVTYLDMALRGRPASTTPEETVHRLEDIAHRPLAPEGSGTEAAGNRRAGIGALLGIAAGLGSGLACAAARSALPRAPLPAMGLIAGAAANIGSVGPMTALGVTDPREWPPSSWASDIIPHLVFGAVTATVYDMLED